MNYLKHHHFGTAATLVATIFSFFILFSFKPSSKVKIFMIGDSTMANKKYQSTPERGWGMVLACFFDDEVEIDNHAVNGRSSKSFIDEGRWQKVIDKEG